MINVENKQGWIRRKEGKVKKRARELGNIWVGIETNSVFLEKERNHERDLQKQGDAFVSQVRETIGRIQMFTTSKMDGNAFGIYELEYPIFILC